MSNPIQAIVNWNEDAGNTTKTINVRQSALYLGLQLEELGEKLEAIGFVKSADVFYRMAGDFKAKKFDHQIGQALAEPARRQAMLDADMDLIVVSTGAAMSQGADVAGALQEVIDSNNSKRHDDLRLHKDTNGKIIKGPNYREPDLKPFMAP